MIKINTPQNESFQEDGGRTAGNVLLHKNSGMLEEVPKLTFSKVKKNTIHNNKSDRFRAHSVGKLYPLVFV